MKFALGLMAAILALSGAWCFFQVFTSSIRTSKTFEILAVVLSLYLTTIGILGLVRISHRDRLLIYLGCIAAFASGAGGMLYTCFFIATVAAMGYVIISAAALTRPQRTQKNAVNPTHKPWETILTWPLGNITLAQKNFSQPKMEEGYYAHALKLLETYQYKAAVQYFEKAAELRHQGAMSKLVDIYTIRDIEYTTDHIFNRLQTFANYENAHARIALGIILIGGYNTPPFMWRYKGISSKLGRQAEGAAQIKAALEDPNYLEDRWLDWATNALANYKKLS